MEINDTMSCQNMNQYKDNMLIDLCDEGINDWFLYYAMQCLFIILLVIRSWMICTVDQTKSVQEDPLINCYGTNGTNGVKGDIRKQRRSTSDTSRWRSKSTNGMSSKRRSTSDIRSGSVSNLEFSVFLLRRKLDVVPKSKYSSAQSDVAVAMCNDDSATTLSVRDPNETESV